MVGSQDNKMIRLDVALDRDRRPQNDFTLRICAQLPGSGVTAIFGASGSGKTTLLRCIAGLEPGSSGSIVVNQSTYQDHKTFLSPQQRNVGFVFQQPTLFPHLNAIENIEFAAKRAKSPISSSQFSALIDVLGIETLLSAYPAGLSGGEKQRVAIARAVASNPSVLLMDEPLAALDAPRKKELLDYLEELQSVLSIPVLYVSHSQSEVARLAEHVVVLEAGQLQLQGAVTEVFNRINMAGGQSATTIVEGCVAHYDEQYHLTQITLEQHSLWLAQGNLVQGSKVRLCIAANDISISLNDNNQSSILNRLPANIQKILPDSEAGLSLIQLNVDGQKLVAKVTDKSIHNLQLQPGMWVWAQIKSAAILR